MQSQASFLQKKFLKREANRGESDCNEMSYRKKQRQRTALGLAGMLMIWTATTAQSQLFIDVYPSQDNTNQTLWIFSGQSTAHYTSTIRSSGNYHRRDSWKLNAAHGFDVYFDNIPTNRLFNLSPLFSSTNQTDIESIESRLQGSSRVTSPFYSGLTFFYQLNQLADSDHRKRKQNHRLDFHEQGIAK